jgi:hypothetical protein
MNHFRTKIFGMFLSAAVMGSAHAIPVTLVGSDVDFTFDNSLTGKYGQPVVSGDTLYFTPTTFIAQSSNGVGYVLTPETINISATAHTGKTIGTANLAERGDYLLLGSSATADVTGQLRAFDVANPGVDMSSAITPTSALNLSGVPSKNWFAAATVDVSSWKTAKTLNFTLENFLLASTTNPDSLAFVQKKYAGLTIMTSAVPEAQVSMLMLAGLGFVGFTVVRSRYRDPM